jgi:hypothetical protein
VRHRFFHFFQRGLGSQFSHFGCQQENQASISPETQAAGSERHVWRCSLQEFLRADYIQDPGGVSATDIVTLNVRRDSNLDARDSPAARPRHNQRHDDVPASALITRFQSRMHRIISDGHPTFVPLYTSTPRYQPVPWKASCYMDSRSRETQEAPFPYPIGPRLHTTQLMWLSKKPKSSPALQNLISGWRCLSCQTVATARVGTTDPTLHGRG